MAIRIIWNSNNIDLKIDDPSIEVPFKNESKVNRAASGKTETINIYNFGEPIMFNAIFSETVYRKLIAFWSWAEQGNVFSFNMDSDNVGNTTLDGAAAAGQKNIPLAATAAVASTDIGIIRSADRTKYEIVVVASVDAGVKVVATDNLYLTYASGDTFRHWHYWPALILPEGEVFNPTKQQGNYFFTFNFLEQL